MAIQRFILGMERLWSWWQFVRRGICYQNSRKTIFQHWWSTMSVAKQEFEYNITKTEQILKWKVNKRFKRDICYASDMSSLLSMHTHDESRNVQNILLLFSLFFIIYCYCYSNYCFRITFWSKLARFTLLALIYVLIHLFCLPLSENEISPLLKHVVHVSERYVFLPYLPVNSIATLCSSKFKITSHQQIKERASLKNENTACEMQHNTRCYSTEQNYAA